jgi:PAS domain S-box-containing protein
MPPRPGEVVSLRRALRDLVALATIPAGWVGREPVTIAAGLADALVGWLRLDFAFVRLCDPTGEAAVEATRGNGWKSFPAWLQRHVDAAGRLPRREIVLDVGGPAGGAGCSGLAIPIGIDGEAGLAAVACGRADFPTETDQILFSVAVNQAATAYQSARLIHARQAAEEALRQARDELEMVVTERTVELRRTGAELRTILDASPLGIVLLRHDHTIQRCNPAFERLLGWSEQEIVGRRIPVPDRLSKAWTAFVSGLNGHGGFSGVEMRILRKDGSEFEAAVACASLSDERGRPAGIVANIEDISHRKRGEEALRKAQAELAHMTRVTTLGELAASIAHEINQPLSAIVADATASLNWLARPDPELDQVRDALVDIVADGHRAAEVLNRVRQLAAKTDPQRHRLYINDVIEEVVSLVRHEVQRHHATVQTQLGPEIRPAVGDRVQLQQVIINLMMNGVEAMATVNDRPRELVIRSTAGDGKTLLVAVQDSGVGIDPRYADQMFNAFFTTKPAGMGMGLSISRSIVEGHGGRLWATQNAPPAHGATFQFTLPLQS